MVKPLAGQTEQTWHSLACAVTTEGKTVHVCGGPKNRADVDRTDETGYSWTVVRCCQNTSDIAPVQSVVSLLTVRQHWYCTLQLAKALPYLRWLVTPPEQRTRFDPRPVHVDWNRCLSSYFGSPPPPPKPLLFHQFSVIIRPSLIEHV